MSKQLELLKSEAYKLSVVMQSLREFIRLKLSRKGTKLHPKVAIQRKSLYEKATTNNDERKASVGWKKIKYQRAKLRMSI